MLGGGGGKDEAHLVRWEFFYLHSCSSFLIRLINHIFVFFNSFFFFFINLSISCMYFQLISSVEQA